MRPEGVRALPASTAMPEVTPRPLPDQSGQLGHHFVVARLGHGDPRRHAAAEIEQLHEVQARLEVRRDRQRSRIAHHRDRRPLLPEQQELRLVVRPAARLDVRDPVLHAKAAGQAAALLEQRVDQAGRLVDLLPQHRRLRARHQVLDHPVLQRLVAKARAQRPIDPCRDRAGLAATRVDRARVGVGARRTARRRRAPTSPPNTGRRDPGASRRCRPDRPRAPPRASPARGRRRVRPWSSG